MATHHYTDKTYYEYDATLTQSLLTKYINTLSSSSATKTDMTYLWSIGNMSRFTGSRHEPNPDISSGESEEPRPSTVTHDYVNFINATGVNFDQARSAAIAAGLSANTIPNGISLNDVGLQATNITFAEGGAAGAYASNTTLSNLTFLGRGGVVEIGGGFVDDANDNPIFVGGQSLNGLKAEEDLDTIVLYPPSRQAATSAVTATNITVSRNLNDLAVAAVTRYGYYGAEATSNRPGTGVEASKITVHGALRYVNIGSGARVDSLTVGDWKQWGDGEASAFLGEDVWGSTSHMSATIMNVYSGGTATNIYLGFGGEVHVSGPGMIYSSQLVSSSGQSWYQYTSSEGTGAGGVLTDLKMATSGGIQFTGNSASELNQKLWKEPTVGYGNRPYMNGYLATAPQSSYVSFGKFTSGRNIEIGNGGSMRIDSGASVSNISMGGLTTSTFFKNSSGTTDTWIGDRGASLQIRGGKVSGVVMDPVIQTFEYYSAAHDYFWLYSSSVSSSMQAAYSSAHGEYPSGSAWESAVYASASAGYRQYMSAMYNSGAVYTNLGDDTAYNRRYVGGDIGVAGGWIMNVSGFSYLGVAADVDVTVSNNVSTWKTYQYTDGNVSKAIGAVSATLDVTGGAHVYNVKIEGGRVIMTGGGEVNARWHSRENKQSNYNLVEDLDLRIGDVLGLGSAYPAVIEFVGSGSGGYSQAIHDSKGGVTGYVDYFWDAIDPGEIHSVTASKGLVVQANWNKQDFTYIGSGAVTFNGLGTVVLKDNHSRYTSDSYYGKGPYLGSAFDTYYFGVVKGVYNEEDGTLENYTVLDGADGGFDWTGFLMVGSGGIVQNIGSAAPLKTGNDIVNSDTWTPSYTRDECKVLTVVAGGLADNVTVKGAVSNFEHYESQYTESRAGLLVSSGGTATNVTVLEGGIAMAKGGTIDKVFVAGGGTLYLSGWAGAHQVAVDSYGSQLAGPQYLDTTVLNAVRLDSGGQLTNTLDWGFRKGNAPSVIANKGGGIMNGVTANGVAYVSGLDFAGNITLTKDQQAIDVTVRGYKTITSRDDEGNPTAYNTTIAYMNVSSGGIVKGATVGEEGAIYVSNGADVSGLVASGGRIIFANSSGWSDYFAGSATVKGITVKDGGTLEVNSKFGLTATDVKIEQDAGLEFTLGKTANEDYTPTALNGTWTADWGNGTFQTNDGVLTGFGGQFGHEYRDLFYSSAYVSARLSMTIIEGGVLAGGDLRGYGSVLVKNGGKMLDTKLQGVGASIAASGYASGLSATVASGKNAYGTNIYVYGSGAVAEATVLNGGYMGVERGGVVNSVTMLCPEGYEGPAGNDTEVGPVEFEVMAGGTANNVIASAGVITLLDGSKEPGTAGPTLSNADVHSAAMLIVKGDGAVLDGTLNLAGTVFTTGKRYEYIEVEVEEEDPNNPGQTIKYTDYQRVEMNNSVADAATLTVNFDLTERTGEEEGAMIDNLANLDGAKLAGITVSADQSAGAYVLAGGSEGFQGTLTVTSDGKKVCDLASGGMYQVSEDVVYKLSNTTDAGLVFSVLTTDAAVTDIVATSNGQELLKGKWSKYAVNIKTEVNQYTKSIWYRIKQAVLNRTRGVEPVEPEWIEFDNEKGIDIAEYCTVEFMAKNEKGKESKVVSYTVNYDATAPEFSDLHLVSGDAFLTPGEESQASVLVVDNLDNAPKLEFSLDGEEWTELEIDDDCRAVFTVTGGIEGFTLRATDHADNVNTLAISIPATPVVSADILTVTNQDVTVSAAFSADSMSKQYSLDGGETWLAYGDGVVLTDNATVRFRAGNILGYSEVADITVDYIDKEAPKPPEAAADITAPTNGDVTVTAEFSEDSVKKEYTLDGGETWQDYEAGGVIIIINGTVGFRGADAAGNTSEVVSVVVDNIDKDAPVITLAGDNETPLQTSALTATVDDGSEIFYSLDNETWTKYEGEIAVAANATYYFKATDAVGNVGTNSIVFANIDTVPPVITLAGDNETPLQASALTATVDDGSELFYSTDNENWLAYEGEIPVTENGTFFFKATDAAGNVGTNSISFENIDNTPPENPVAVADIVEITEQNVTVSATFSDDSVVREFSLDGENWTVYTVPITFEKNGSVSFRAADAAGNISEVVTCTVDNIVRNGPDDHKNDKLIDDDGKPNPAIVESAGTPIEEGVEDVKLDGSVAYEGDDGTVYNNYLGDGDESDITKIVLENGACLSFGLGTTGAVKFMVSKIVETVKKGSVTFKQKSLQTVSLKPKKNQNSAATSTKQLWLEAGEYYVSMANGKKGGEAYYNIGIDDASKFFTDGDNGDNNWLYDSKAKVWNDKVTDAEAIVLDEESRGAFVQIDDAEIEGHGELTNFVGFGDAADIRKVEFASAANVNFDVALSGGRGKFFLYAIDEKGKLKTVASNTLKASGAALKKPVLVDAGTYYIAFQSSNANKGDEVYYNVKVNANSVFYTDGDSGANNYDSKAKAVSADVRANAVALEAGKSLQIDGLLEADAGLVVDHDGFTNFVGTGDASDIVKINAAVGDTLSLKVAAADAVSLTLYGLKNGKVTSIKSVKSKNGVAAIDNFTFQSKNGTEFFVGVEASNAKKGEAAWYNVEVVSFSGSSADALAMPEASDGLAIADSLSFVQNVADALADVSADALAGLDDSAWRNMLA